MAAGEKKPTANQNGTDRAQFHCVRASRLKMSRNSSQIPGEIEKDYLTQVPRLSDRFDATTTKNDLFLTHNPHLKYS